mgnify:CR=1 FL=1
MKLQPYLYFDGRCEEAIAFYTKVLGARRNLRRSDIGGAGRPGPCRDAAGQDLLVAALRHARRPIRCRLDDQRGRLIALSPGAHSP